MDKAWAYAGLQGWGSGTQVEFLKPLLDELVKWTKSVSEDYLWFPGGYTEWTLAGHFAVMADRCDFIPFQEYTLKLPTSKGPDSSEKIVRPDLYIASRNKDGQPSVLFEFKARNMSLGEEWKEPVNIRNRIQEAYDELRKIRDANGEWATHGCCAFGIGVSMKLRDRDNDLWQEKWHKAGQYKEAWETLLARGLKKDLEDNAGGIARSFGRVYYCSYRMSHPLVKKQYKYAEKNGLDEMPIGMLWVFTVREWSKI